MGQRLTEIEQTNEEKLKSTEFKEVLTKNSKVSMKCKLKVG